MDDTPAARTSAYDVYKEALELAYPLAIESYKEAERRMDVVEKRLQDLMAFATSATLGIIALYAGKIDLHTNTFYIALALCLAGILIGFRARLYGSLWLLSLNTLNDYYLVYPEAKFKHAIIDHAGNHSDKNAKTIRNKANLTVVAAITFLLEAVFLVATAVNQPISATPPNQASRPAAAGGADCRRSVPGARAGAHGGDTERVQSWRRNV